MGKFSKAGGREMPELNTSSLPDLVFAFLFFIMMVTSMREVTLMVQFRAPQATERQKFRTTSLRKNPVWKKKTSRLWQSPSRPIRKPRWVWSQTLSRRFVKHTHWRLVILPVRLLTNLWIYKIKKARFLTPPFLLPFNHRSEPFPSKEMTPIQ